MMAINDFHGKYFFLSNFYEHPFCYKGKVWKSVEHAFQAAKCVNSTDYDQIHAAATPGEAKRLGRRCTIMPGWDTHRNQVMKECLLMKFLTDDDLLQKLLDTGTELLVEGNTWHDNYWGDCSCEKCANKHGQNTLGRYLMEIRDNARNGNYLWVARDSRKGLAIIMHFKDRERAKAWMCSQPGYKPDYPYEANGYQLSVVELK